MDSWERVDRYWARELGLDSSLASMPPIYCTVQHHYSGVRLFSNGERLIIASPPDRAEQIKKATVGITPEEAFSVDWLQRVFAYDAEKIRGPAEVCYADEMSFRAEPGQGGRALLASEYDAYSALVESLDPKEAEESGVQFPVSSSQFPDAFPAFGAFSEGTLCSVASYEVWQPSIAQIHIVTHPKYRRRGFARAAVQALAAEALDRGLILQWRAHVWNEGSLSLARALGFEYYCSTLYVRLRNPV
ncbi:MAG: GNAT family N-acetyltransferase [Blastocatellia bacterium]|nr:GNAT family N-acetyltransferase [Blastocatellia bacterium]